MDMYQEQMDNMRILPAKMQVELKSVNIEQGDGLVFSFIHEKRMDSSSQPLWPKQKRVEDGRTVEPELVLFQEWPWNWSTGHEHFEPTAFSEGTAAS